MYNNPFEDFTEQLIDQTYQKVLHLADDGYLSDGTGSYVGLKISGSLIVTDTINNVTLISNGTGYKYLSDDGTYKIINISGSGEFVTTQSFNQFTQSYYTDSQSFDYRINNITSSIPVNTGSFVTTQSFNQFTQSYIIDSQSFDYRINQKLDSSSFNTFTESINIEIYNLNQVSQSINLFTQSLNVFTQSYYVDSQSFDNRLNNISCSIDTSSFVTTQSFNQFTQSIQTFTQSYYNDSSSFDYRINNIVLGNNVIISQSNQLLLSFPITTPDYIKLDYEFKGLTGTAFGQIQLGWFNSESIHTQITTNDVGYISDLTFTSSVSNSICNLYAVYNYEYDKTINISSGSNLIGIFELNNESVIIDYKLLSSTGANFGHLILGTGHNNSVFSHTTTQNIGTISELSFISEISNSCLLLYGITDDITPSQFIYHVNKDTYFSYDVLSYVSNMDITIPIISGSNLLVSIPITSGNMAVVEYKLLNNTGATFGTTTFGYFNSESVFNQYTTNKIGTITELNFSSSVNGGNFNLYGLSSVNDSSSFIYTIYKIQ